MDVGKLKVAELKDELSKRGLETKGLKKDLADRLSAFLEGGDADVAMKDEPEVDGTDEPKASDEAPTAVKVETPTAVKDQASASITNSTTAGAVDSRSPTIDDISEATVQASPAQDEDAMETDAPASALSSSSSLRLPASLSHLTDLYPPSSVLYIANLRRPLLLSALHEHLNPTSLPATPALPFAHDDYPGLWLSGVKDHAYAGYDCTADALAAAARVHGAIWPEGTGAPLDVQFVDPARVAELTAKEEAAWGKRQRLVLDVRERGGAWEFDVVSPGAAQRRGGLANPDFKQEKDGDRSPERRGSIADRLSVPRERIADRLAGGERERLADRLSPEKERERLTDRLGSPDKERDERERESERLADRLSEKRERDDTDDKEPESRLGPVKRTRTEPVLEYREGPGAGERRRKGGKRGGKGSKMRRDARLKEARRERERERRQGADRRGGGMDSWRPGGGGGGGGGGGRDRETRAAWREDDMYTPGDGGGRGDRRGGERDRGGRGGGWGGGGGSGGGWGHGGTHNADRYIPGGDDRDRRGGWGRR